MFGIRRMDGCRIEVNTKAYKESATQEAVKNSSQFIRFIDIHGAVSEQEDLPIFEEISKYCHESTTKLTIEFVQLETLDIDRLDIFPNLKELELGVCCKLSLSFMQFDRWCPNLISLKIGNVYFNVPELYEDWLVLTENHKSPLLRSVHFEVPSKNDVYAYMDLFERQFPSLENLFLDFGSGMDFTSKPSRLNLSSPGSDEDNEEYESLYFDKLKKLTVIAYGECNDIFNYLGISNKMLKEIEFCGMNADKELINSICSNYPKLTKLKFGCTYVDEDELDQLTSLSKLMTLTLDCKRIDWKPSKMLTFIRNAKRLRRLIIDVDRGNSKYQIDDKFKEEFQTLIQSGRKFLQLNIKFFQSSQEIKLSKKDMVVVQPDVSSQSESGF